MDIKKLILAKIKEKGSVRSPEIIKETGFSRAYINRFFRELVELGLVEKVGKTNKTKYVFPGLGAKKDVLNFFRTFSNSGLREEEVLKQIKQETGIFFGLKKNIIGILDYTFTEMLNNAIDHSQSDKIVVKMNRDFGKIIFVVRDYGVGIFNNIQTKKKLSDITFAIQTLLKGKQTTDPERHTGQGVFFTSKLADNFIVKSYGKNLIIDNINKDFFIKDSVELKGTRVSFAIDEDGKKTAREVFNKFTDEETFEFNKTQIRIKLYKINDNLISRSEAKRVLLGLDKFEEVVLDFKDVETVGQGFADEIFRVWQNNHKGVKISHINANENVEFMIKHTLEI